MIEFYDDPDQPTTTPPELVGVKEIKRFPHITGSEFCNCYYVICYGTTSAGHRYLNRDLKWRQFADKNGRWNSKEEAKKALEEV